jgi:hypothetical protein
VKNHPRQEAGLMPLLFSIILEYAIYKVQENQGALALNRTYHLLACADLLDKSNKYCKDQLYLYQMLVRRLF